MLCAVLAAYIGLGDAVTTLGALAKVLFWVFVAGFVFSLVLHFSRSSLS